MVKLLKQQRNQQIIIVIRIKIFITVLMRTSKIISHGHSIILSGFSHPLKFTYIIYNVDILQTIKYVLKSYKMFLYFVRRCMRKRKLYIIISKIIDEHGHNQSAGLIFKHCHDYIVMRTAALSVWHDGTMALLST